MRLSYSGQVCLPSKEDTVSSNLISRSTVNAFTKSFLLQLILDTRIGYLGSFCYIGNFRRTHISNTMRVVSTHLVTSTATTTISVIPTDTPVTRWVVNACVVEASGDVYVSDNYSDVSYYSYGNENRRTIECSLIMHGILHLRVRQLWSLKECIMIPTETYYFMHILY